MINNVISFLLIFLFLTAQAGANEKSPENIMNLSQSVDKLRNAIVQISISTRHSLEEVRNNPNLKRHEHRTLGTGFFVNDEGYVVTARHVVADIKTDMHTKLQVGVAYPNTEESGIQITNSFNLIDSEVIDEDTIHDLAILKLKVNPFHAKFPALIKLGDKEIGMLKCVVPTLDARRPKDGENIAVSGYPFTGNILITTSGYIASSWGVESKEVQRKDAPLGFSTIDTSDVYLADLTVNPGNSGGPVYAVNEGKIIGVCVSQLLAMALTIDSAGKVVPIHANGQPVLYNSSVANIIPMKYVIDLLMKNKINFAKE